MGEEEDIRERAGGPGEERMIVRMGGDIEVYTNYAACRAMKYKRKTLS
ncbi:MAG: hypothetical protein ACXWCG_07385 [Flavitalea sp.]